MRISIYGDAHITRNMKSIQSHWNNSVLCIFNDLYDNFALNNVEMAVCLGDLFDKAVLEAKSVKLVTEILSIMNSAKFPTYVLLGNHEIDSNDNNILEYLSEYDNIIPVTDKFLLEDKFLFIPYSVNLEDVPKELIEGKYVFTHHDIYGSELAGGKVKASFGVDPIILSGAAQVFNGHVHLSSKLGNIYNVGSITKMQQGELVGGTYPTYYYLVDDLKGSPEVLKTHLMNNFIAYLTVTPVAIEGLLDFYDESVKFVLRIAYSDRKDLESIEKYKNHPRILSMSYRSILSGSIESENEVVKKSVLDIKEFLSNYIMKDELVPDSEKENIIKLGLSILGE